VERSKPEAVLPYRQMFIFPQKGQEKACFNPSAMKHFEKIPTDHIGIK
jgi:hypothetical protein